ncbi:MAG: DUF1684 domain-containing protein [Trueperaceae bacterium]
MNDHLASSSFAELLDYRRQVAELYAEVRRSGSGAPGVHNRFQEGRNDLFAAHPQSPLSPPQRRGFTGLSFFPYEPSLRFCLSVDTDVQAEVFEVRLEDDGLVELERVAKVRLSLKGRTAELSLFWLGGYGGGLFLPFRDATNGAETYGGGRYLLDTIKGAELGEEEGRLVIDFNYAYNPSCAYDSSWDCPLPPAENRLELPIRAGEKAFSRP